MLALSVCIEHINLRCGYMMVNLFSTVLYGSFENFFPQEKIPCLHEVPISKFYAKLPIGQLKMDTSNVYITMELRVNRWSS